METEQLNINNANHHVVYAIIYCNFILDIYNLIKHLYLTNKNKQIMALNS